MWRHCGHVGGVLVVRTKHFSPLGTIPYFHENSSRKNSILLTTNTHPTWLPCHVVANQENAKVICFVSSNERRRRKQRKKSKKELVYEQNNLFTRASRFLIHSLTSLHDSWCDVLWGTLIYDDEFYFLFLNLDKVLKNSTPGESAFIWKIRKGPNRRYKVSNNANSFYHFRRCFHCRRCVVAYAYYWCLLTVLRSCFVVENRLWWCHRIEQNSRQLRCLWR